jgi:hypothetical protein
LRLPPESIYLKLCVVRNEVLFILDDVKSGGIPHYYMAEIKSGELNILTKAKILDLKQ